MRSEAFLYDYLFERFFLPDGECGAGDACILGHTCFTLITQRHWPHSSALYFHSDLPTFLETEVVQSP